MVEIHCLARQAARDLVHNQQTGNAIVRRVAAACTPT